MFKELKSFKEWSTSDTIGMTIAMVLFFGFWFWVFVQRVDFHLALYATLLIGLIYCIASLLKAVPSLEKGKLDWNELCIKSWQLIKSESKRGGKWIIFTIVICLIIAMSFRSGKLFSTTTILLVWFIMWIFWWDSNIITADGFVRISLWETEDENGKGVYAMVYGIRIDETTIWAYPLLIASMLCMYVTLWTLY